MRWRIEGTDEFNGWLDELVPADQERVVASIKRLAAYGPRAGRPLVDTLHGSKHANMKELRIPRTIRIMFAFDPDRIGILLVAGDKAGKAQKRWYKSMISKADRLYDDHLERNSGDDEGSTHDHR